MGRQAAVAVALLLAGCAPVVAPPRNPVFPTPAPPPPPPAPPRIVAAEFLLSRAPEQGGIAFGTLPPGAQALTLDGAAVAFAPDGRFLVGFGRDHGPAAVLEARMADGRILRQPLAVAPRAWDVQSLPTLRRGTTPTPEFLARRKGELEQIVAARALRSASDGWRGPFAWPATGRISGVFGSQRIYAGERGDYHAGVDIARPTGTPVTAPADGVVVLAAPSPFSLEGNLLIVDHGMGLTSAFLHLSRIDVTLGQRVVRGERLGAIGATGRATGPHLHWAMVWQGQRLDPQRIAPPMP